MLVTVETNAFGPRGLAVTWHGSEVMTGEIGTLTGPTHGALRIQSSVRPRAGIPRARGRG
eukprot:4437265-Pyramimonas_sp.AAC.1